MAAWTCTNCGFQNQPGFRSCAECGAAAGPAMKAPAPPPVPPPAQRPGSGKPCLVVVAFLMLALTCCCTWGFWASRTHRDQGTVSGLAWERSIDATAMVEVREESSTIPPKEARDISMFVDKLGNTKKYIYTID